MFMPSRISPTLGVTALGLALCWAASAASADGPGLGKPVTEADVAAWDISIEPSGKGLPPGAGTPSQGAHISVEKCAACHGPEGKAGVTGMTAAPLPPLVGGDPITDISAATKRIANFWPYPTTRVRRSRLVGSIFDRISDIKADLPNIKRRAEKRSAFRRCRRSSILPTCRTIAAIEFRVERSSLQ
jgi:hypothetical protein